MRRTVQARFIDCLIEELEKDLDKKLTNLSLMEQAKYLKQRMKLEDEFLDTVYYFVGLYNRFYSVWRFKDYMRSHNLEFPQEFLDCYERAYKRVRSRRWI